MKVSLPSILLLASLVALACEAAAPGAPSGPAGPELRNPAFDEPGAGLPGWQRRGDTYGEAERIEADAASPPHAVRLSARGPGSTGERSFMLFQVLDPTPHRGRTLEFGAQVDTEGAGVNLVLYTPEKSANVFLEQLDTPGWKRQRGTLEVPENASFLSFGIQIFGPAGGGVRVDDAFVRPVGGAEAQSAPPPRSAEGAAPSAGTPSGAPGAAEARVRIRADRALRTLPDIFFGMHIEWVERGLGLLEPDRPALRGAAVEALRPLSLGLYRFPGGIHADFYDWRQGVGPASERGEGRNAFTGERERHHFGTPELLELMEATGVEDALITANFGTGRAEDAGAWAAHFAGRGEAPRYWEVGNEIYLSGPETTGPNSKEIFAPGAEYAERFPAYRRAIRAAIPEAKVGLIGHLDTGAFPLAPAGNRDWTRRMLDAFEGEADFLALHNAYAPVILDGSVDFGDGKQRAGAYRALYAAAEQTRENLAAVRRELAKRAPQVRDVPLALTEFGPFFGLSQDARTHAVYVDQTRTLAAALYTASILHVALTDPGVLTTCYTNPIHRWYGSLLTDTQEGLVRTPTWHLYALYARRFERRLVEAEVEGPAFDAPRVGIVEARRGVPALLAHASRSAEGRRMTAMLIHRGQQESLETHVAFDGFAPAEAECRVLADRSPAAVTGPTLSGTTRKAEGGIAPRPWPCAVAEGASGEPGVALRVPPNAVVSVVVEGG